MGYKDRLAELEAMGSKAAPRADIDRHAETIDTEGGYTDRLKRAMESGPRTSWGGSPDAYYVEHDRGALERKRMFEAEEAKLRKCGKWSPQMQAIKDGHDAQNAADQRTTIVALGASGRWDLPVNGRTVRDHFRADSTLEPESRKMWAAARSKCGRPNTGWGRSDDNFSSSGGGGGCADGSCEPPKGGGFWSKLFGL